MTWTPRDQKSLVDEAKNVLAANWREGYTVPHGSLYPFQWLWDSGFTALGYCHFDPEKAQQELRNLFKGQWKNGLLPHIMFHRSDPGYFPGPNEWDVSRSPQAPTAVPTSGITQPPVIGFILEMMLDRASNRETMLPFVEELYPRVVHLHRYLYTNRDPRGEGLIYIQHPWESGADNSPLWDGPLAAVVPDDTVHDIEARRRDTTHVARDERPSTEEYEKYMHLVYLFRACRYQDDHIVVRSPFLVQDSFVNATLIRSNESLIMLGRLLGNDVAEIEAWNEASRAAMNDKLWNPGSCAYDGFDLRTDARLAGDSALGLLAPLFAGVPNRGRAARMVDALRARFARPGYYWCPTFSPDALTFEPRRYWRGPVWISTNWMLYHGLIRYDYPDLARGVKRDTIDLIRRCGFCEYFSPIREDPEGLGAKRFSWSAALLLDLLLTSDVV